MRSFGISIEKIAQTVVRVAVFFLVLIFLMGEIIAPVSTQYAQTYRAQALGQSVSQNQQGFWLKDQNYIINVGKNINGKQFQDVVIFQLKGVNKMAQTARATRAIFNGETLKLLNADTYKINNKTIQHHSQKDYAISVSFDEELIESFRKTPEELSSWNLYKQIDFLQDNRLIATPFEAELYKRLIKPITLVAMLLFSMLFIFGSLRDASLGKKIFLGVAISLFFELASRMGNVISLGFNYDPLLSATVPSFVVWVIAHFLLKFKSNR
jgi:lipopolysaccharide export system permease protein